MKEKRRETEEEEQLPSAGPTAARLSDLASRRFLQEGSHRIPCLAVGLAGCLLLVKTLAITPNFST